MPNLFSITTLMMFCFLINAHCIAEQISDPMRPPNLDNRAYTAQSVKRPQWHVTAILVSEGRRLAMVNQRLVSVGATVDGAMIKAIYGDSVELDVSDRKVIITPEIQSIRRTK